MIYMIMRFPDTRSSWRTRFQTPARLYVLLMGAFSGILVFLTIYSTTPRFISFAKDATLNPVADNYTAPFSEELRLPHVNKKVIGFLPSWNIAAKKKVYPEYLDQIIFFGIPIDKNGVLLKKDENDVVVADWYYLDSAEFRDIRTRAKQTNTKILVTIKNFDNASIDALISSPTTTKRAIQEIQKLITDYELDGIDLNFEYFTASDYPTMLHMNQFLTTLRTELKKEHPSLILSFDVNATVIYQDTAYDMVKIGEQMDQVIIMGYDYTQPSSPVAGPIAPLYESGNKPSVSRSVASVIGRVPKEKIILAIPLYGLEWQTYTDHYASNTIPNTGAIATYERVRDLIANRVDISIRYGEITKSPWLTYKQNGQIRQIHYEDEKSILSKIDIAYEKDIAGIALWALGYEGNYVEPWNIIKEHVRAQK